MTRKERQNRKKTKVIIISIAIAAIIYILTYLDGGVESLLSNLMYIPILIVGFTLGLKAGFITSMFAGLLLVTMISFEFSENIDQEIVLWAIKLAAFIISGTLAGYLSDQYRYNKRLVKTYEAIAQKSNY